MARQLPKSITPAQFRSLYAQASRRYPTGRRNRALIASMYFAGLRVSEAAGLAPGDIDLDGGGWLHVRNGKGGADRDLALTPELMAPLAEWFEVREAERKLDRSPHLFCTLDGKPLSPRYVHAMVTRYSQKAGVYVVKKVTRKLANGRRVKVDEQVPAWPHCLRHSFAVNMVEAGAEPPAIQAALGHSDLRTTSVYTAMRAESVRAAVLAGAQLGARADAPRSQAGEDMASRLAAAAAA